MLSAWVAIGLNLPQEHQRVFSILLVSSRECDHSFPGQFFFTDSFETQGSYMYGHSFVKSDEYWPSEVSFLQSHYFYLPKKDKNKFRLWHLYDETFFIFKICLYLFEFTWYFIWMRKLRPKKVALFPEIGWVKKFLSPTQLHKSNVYENIYFLFQQNTHTQTLKKISTCKFIRFTFFSSKNKRQGFLFFNKEKCFSRVQKQTPEVFCKKGVLRNFAKFTGKTPVPETLF